MHLENKHKNRENNSVHISNWSWAAFSLFFAFAAAFETLLELWLTEGGSSSVRLFLYLAAMSITTLAFIFLVSLLVSRLQILLLSAFSAFCVVTLKLMFFETFLELSNWKIVTVLVVLTAIFAVFGYLVSTKRKPSLLDIAIVSIVLIVTPLLSAFQEQTRYQAAIDASSTDSKIFQMFNSLRFEQTPNVYYFSFDSMVPAYIAGKYLGIERLPYQNALDQHFNELFPSAVIRTPTKPSLNALMRLDQDLDEKRIDMFSGQSPSLLAEVFRSNGYEVTTGYESYYLGFPGPWIDRYRVSDGTPLAKSTLCIDLSSRKTLMLRAFSACSTLGWLQKNSENNGPVFHFLSKLFGWSGESWVDSILREIQPQKRKPTLKIFHTYDPIGHTKSDYIDSPEAREKESNRYFRKAKELAVILEELSLRIAEYDPDSILLIAGDHGDHLSRGANAKEKNPVFFYEDRNVISLALLKSGHKCGRTENLQNHFEGFYTPSRAFVSIISCLSDGNDAELLIDFEKPSKDLLNVLQNIPTH